MQTLRFCVFCFREPFKIRRKLYLKTHFLTKISLTLKQSECVVKIMQFDKKKLINYF